MYKKYDWEKIRRSYIEGYNNNGKVVFLNLSELANKCKIECALLLKHAAEEKWKYQREIYRKKIEHAKKQEVTKVLAGQGAEFDSKTLELARAGILQIKAYFLAQKKMMRKAKEENKENIPLLDPKVLDSMSKALVAFQKVGKLALGEELPPEKSQNKFVIEFLREEKILTNEQKGQFLKLALRIEKEIFSSVNKPKINK